MKTPDEFPKAGDSVKAQEAEKKLIAGLKQKMGDLLDKRGIREYQRWHERCIEVIQRTYPDPRERHKYRLYHAFIGSTGYHGLPNFDFPGECSIQRMIEELEV